MGDVFANWGDLFAKLGDMSVDSDDTPSDWGDTFADWGDAPADWSQGNMFANCFAYWCDVLAEGDNTFADPWGRIFY